MVTSTWGAEKPKCEETCFIEMSNFGSRAFAADPPSTPNSVNLSSMKYTSKETKDSNICAQNYR